METWETVALERGGKRFPMMPSSSSPPFSFLATFVTRDCRFCRRSITDVTCRSCHTTPGNVAADDSEGDDYSNDDDDDDGGDDDDASLLW